jgi:hypothetical protein
MSAKRKKLGLGFWCAIAFATTAMAPVLYLLLLGPIYCLLINDKITENTYRVLSNPLQLWIDNISGSTPAWFWQWYQAYMKWWWEFT